MLAAFACVGAVFVAVVFARTTMGEKRAAGRDAALQEVAALYGRYVESPVLETRRMGIRHFGDLQSGFLRKDLKDEWTSMRFFPVFYAARETAAVASNRQGGDVAVEETDTPDGGIFVVAVKALPDEGYAWAATKIEYQPNMAILRIAAVALGLASLLLVAAALETLLLFQRGVGSILGSLRAVERDLSADVALPAMKELASIAGGVSTLAKGLHGAQNEKDVLAAELAAKERLAALGRVVAGVAHEVRNPLAAMRLRVDMALESGDLGPRHERELDVVSSEITRLDRLVSDLLLVAGQRSIERRQYDLGDLVAARVELLTPWAAERGVQLSVAGQASAEIDADSVARLIDNLVRNAVEASPEGGVVSIDVLPIDEGQGARVQIAVRVFDEGEGVPPDHAAELFEPFFTLKPKGTGLGLAISRAIVAAHGGALAYRREGDRTCFEATFAAVPSAS